MRVLPPAPARDGRLGRSEDGVRVARQALDDGLAHNATGRPVQASAAFRAVLRALGPEPPPGTAADPLAAYLRSRALLGLVMSDYELRADVDRSRGVLDAAERWAAAAAADAVEVAVDGQRGLLEMRAGRPDAALRALDRAAARLAAAEPLDACVLLLNRGSLQLELGHLRRARADLEECVRRAALLGDPLLEFKARHNLGYLEFLGGDLPAALGAMADAARLEHGGSPAVALLDRAQVLLEAGLVTEADATLARAARLFRDQHLAHDLAQVELTRARCALVAGRTEDAVRWALSARHRFTRRRNEAWRVHAGLVVERARLAALLSLDEPSRTALRGVARRALALAGAPAAARTAGRPAALVAAEALAAAGDVAAARDAVRRAGRLTGREPLTVAMQVHVVRAGLAYAVGDDRAGRRHVRAGQTQLAEHRRRLGSVEAVTAAAAHGERLTLTEVSAALRCRDPVAVLDAVEHGRATFAGPARVRPPEDPALADLLARLRRCVEAQRLVAPDEPGAAAALGALRREAAGLSEQLREGGWRLGEGARAPSPVTARELRAALRGPGAPTVAVLVVHGGLVHAVVVEGWGARLLELAEVRAVTEVARRLRTDLSVLAHGGLPDMLRTGVRRSLDRGLALLDELLVAPLGAAGGLHVAAPGRLVTLPWGLAPSRRGLPTAVGTRLGRTGGGAAPGRSAVALAGPGLAHAAGEAHAVAEVWGSGRALVGPDATVAAAARALREADVVHLAAHGHHEGDNPLFSSLRLADGPLFAYELDAAPTGATVVLSACELGRTTVRAGGEALGLASVLLRLGAGAVVAAPAPVADRAAAAVMPVLHERLRAGQPAPAALADALSGVDEPPALTCFTLDVGACEEP